MNQTLERHFGESTVYWKFSGVKPEISPTDIAVFLSRGTPRRTQSLVKGVHILPPGHKLISVGKSEVQLKRLWSACTANHRKESIKDITAQLYTALNESVLKIAEHSCQTGLLLSGGLDSTILAYLFKHNNLNFTCYTIEFEGNAGPKEWTYASLVAEKLGIALKKIMVKGADIEPVISRLQDARPAPYVCWVAINQYIAAKEAAEDGCDALAMGLGSDEIFGGYHKLGRYYHRTEEYIKKSGINSLWDILLGPPSRMKNYLLYTGQACPFPVSCTKRLFPGIDIQHEIQHDILLLYEELKQQIPNLLISSAMLQLELELRTSDILLDELETASRLHGIKLYCPFLSPKLLIRAAAIPSRLKYHHGAAPELHFLPRTKAVDKYILRLTFQDIVPPDIQCRPRMTYTLPFHSWLMKENRLHDIKTKCLHSTLWDSFEVNKKELSSLFNKSLKRNPWEIPFRIWILFQLTSWWERGGPHRLENAAHEIGEQYNEP
jgi:asparagine synthetase B (glutamine-hydrolysing)